MKCERELIEETYAIAVKHAWTLGCVISELSYLFCVADRKTRLEKRSLQATPHSAAAWTKISDKLRMALDDRDFLVQKLGLTDPWLPLSSALAIAFTRSEARLLQGCASKLEVALIGRLLELEKAGLSGTSESLSILRQHLHVPVHQLA